MHSDPKAALQSDVTLAIRILKGENTMSTFETLKGMIAKQMKVNPDTVTESSRLVEDLKADSANVMVMIMDVEDTFGITVEDDQIMKLKTVGDVVKYIDANK
jgi:acyl carrier protein